MSMTEFKQHLIQRGLTNQIRCWVNYEEEIVRFPIWTMDGCLVGYHRYNWVANKTRNNDEGGRYITKVNSAYRNTTFWGVEYLSKSHILFYTEGVWDAVRCIQAGYSAIALLTATPSKQMIQYLSYLFGHRKTVALCDNDKSGTGLKLARASTHYRVVPMKDMGEMNPIQAKEFLDGI